MCAGNPDWKTLYTNRCSIGDSHENEQHFTAALWPSWGDDVDEIATHNRPITYTHKPASSVDVTRTNCPILTDRA